MRIEYDIIPSMTLEEFGDKHGLTLVVRERPPRVIAMGHVGENRRYYASFNNVESKNGSILCGESGSGRTPELAIADYAARITGKNLVINAMSHKRRVDLKPTHIYVEE